MAVRERERRERREIWISDAMVQRKHIFKDTEEKEDYSVLREAIPFY